MPITILDYVKSVVGDKDLYTAEDCLASGVDILGGCQGCHATITATTPTRPPPVLALRRLHRHDGFATIADFTAPPLHTCPACGTGGISETRVTTGEHAEGYVLECCGCGEVWQL
jgi:hypothetical protein